jgi:sulfatase maturation enzyme AslB (radical SAM superfamily)
MLIKPRDFQGLNVTIHTNNNCTLKCSYCYENKSRSIAEDKLFWRKTGEDIKDFRYMPSSKKNDYKILSLDYAKIFLDKLLTHVTQKDHYPPC